MSLIIILDQIKHLYITRGIFTFPLELDQIDNEENSYR
jgi:hypothetical protein